MIIEIQKPDIIPILDREMDNLTSELKLFIALLYEVGEEYLISKPDTPHNQAVAQACSLLIDELLEVQR